jgi:hypothetical protein
MQSFGEFSSIRSILAALLISCFVPSDGSANPSAEWILTSPVVAQFVHCGRFPWPWQFGCEGSGPI